MKRVTVVVWIVLLLLTAAGCGKTDPAQQTAQTRTVVDALGREVEIPAEVKRIVPMGNATRLGVYLGVADRFVAINQGDLSQNVFTAYCWYNREAWEKLPLASSGGYGVFHPEAILEANPDVIICTYEADIVADLEAQTGIPVVALEQGTLFGDDYDGALQLMGEVCGVSDRAEQVISFIDGCLEDLKTRTQNIPAADKPLVLGAAATFRGGHGISGVYVDSPVLAAVAANDAAVGLEKESFDTGVEVDREQLLVWNPEIILLDSGNVGLVETEYAEDPAFFAQLSAVQNGKVYQWPNSTSNYTNVEIPLVNAYFAGRLLYPEAFADVDFAAKAEEIFRFFLGQEGYLQDLTDNGAGYQAVCLGE